MRLFQSEEWRHVRYLYHSLTQQRKDTRKGGKSKKTQLKFTIDCSTPVEDEIMDAGAFVSHYIIIGTSIGTRV